MKIHKILSLLTVLLLGIGSANAATLTYTDRTSFLAALDGETTITFNGLAPEGGYSVLSGQTIDGVTFSNVEENLLVISPSYAPSYYDWDSGDIVASYFYGSRIRAELPANHFAVGADLMMAEYYVGATTGTMIAELTFVDDTTFTASITTLAQPDRAFLGFTSDKAIKEINFYTPDTTDEWYPFPLMDNFTIAASIIPEPTTAGLILGGSLLVWWPRRRV